MRRIKFKQGLLDLIWPWHNQIANMNICLSEILEDYFKSCLSFIDFLLRRSHFVQVGEILNNLTKWTTLYKIIFLDPKLCLLSLFRHKLHSQPFIFMGKTVILHLHEETDRKRKKTASDGS